LINLFLFLKKYDNILYGESIVEIKDYLGKEVLVKVERKLGEMHKLGEIAYMVNYGYIPNTINTDGEEIDAYIVGVFKPVDEYKGNVIAIIHRTNDDDDKLVVAPNGVNYTDDQIRALTEFQEQFFKSIIIR
jgi:inorganic pyrophosphatase